MSNHPHYAQDRGSGCMAFPARHSDDGYRRQQGLFRCVRDSGPFQSCSCQITRIMRNIAALAVWLSLLATPMTVTDDNKAFFVACATQGLFNLAHVKSPALCATS